MEPIGDKTGLSAGDTESIREAARKFSELHQLVLFGSRAKGTHKPGSDVDLAIKGDKVTYNTSVDFSAVLNEEITLPYFFDVLNYQTISEPALKEHIDRVGIIIFDRNQESL